MRPSAPQNRRPLCLAWLVALAGGALTLAPPALAADPSSADSVRHDRRLYAGTWQVTAIENDGEQSAADDVRRLTVVNDDAGGWTLLRDGVEVVHGTSTIDPEASPKTIDFEITSDDGKGQLLLGIYEIGERTRRLCLRSPGEWRPREFTAGTGTRAIMMTFERLP
jgi:uncharacterized protein (TIGR03067 family)